MVMWRKDKLGERRRKQIRVSPEYTNTMMERDHLEENSITHKDISQVECNTLRPNYRLILKKIKT